MSFGRFDTRVPVWSPARHFPDALALAFALGVTLTGCSSPRSAEPSPSPSPSPAPAPASAFAAEACANGGWMAPIEPRLADGRRVGIASPTLTRVRTGLVIAGVPTFVWHSDTIAVDTTGIETRVPSITPNPRTTSAGALLRPDGVLDLLPFPPGVPFMAGELTTPDGHGGLHVAWGLPRFPLGYAIPRALSIWYAHFDGRRWSRPELVLEADQLRFEKGSARVLVDDGVIHILVGASDRSHSPRSVDGMAYARRVNGRWQHRWFDLPIGVRYNELVALGHGELLIPYLGTIATADGTHNNAFAYYHSTDNGESWEGPHMVRDLGEDVGYHLRAVRDARGITHLTWISAVFGDARLRHVASREPDSWTEPAEVQLHAAIFSYDIALDHTDTLRALIQTLPEGALAMTTWADTGWTEVTTLPIRQSYAIAGIDAADDTLYVAGAAGEVKHVTATDSMLGIWLQLARRIPCAARERRGTNACGARGCPAAGASSRRGHR